MMGSDIEYYLTYFQCLFLQSHFENSLDSTFFRNLLQYSEFTGSERTTAGANTKMTQIKS